MSLSSLVERAATPTPYAIVDHHCAGLEHIWRGERANRTQLPPATYYLAGVQNAQREVYDAHCEERFASRSPYHYSSVAEVEELLRLGVGPVARVAQALAWEFRESSFPLDRRTRRGRETRTGRGILSEVRIADAGRSPKSVAS